MFHWWPLVWKRHYRMQGAIVASLHRQNDCWRDAYYESRRQLSRAETLARRILDPGISGASLPNIKTPGGEE